MKPFNIYCSTRFHLTNSPLDIVANIPDEIALHLLSFLDLQDIVSCLRVSRYVLILDYIAFDLSSRIRTWRRLASDNAVWHSLFARRRHAGWVVDFRRLRTPTLTTSSMTSLPQVLSRSYRFNMPAPLELDWRRLCRNRAELDRRWSTTPHVGHNIEDKENARVWEPRIRRMLGHTDRCVCIHHYQPRLY